MTLLAFHNLRRIVRNRAMVAALVALPLIAGLARTAFPDSRYSLGLVWACPFVCAGMACVALLLQRAVDDTTGLADAFRNSPAGDGLAVSRFLAAILLSMSSMAVLVVILAISAFNHKVFPHAP